MVAIVTSEAVGAFFQRTRFPQTRAMAAFHMNTAHGKLKAEITPTMPTGFQTYMIRWSGR